MIGREEKKIRDPELRVFKRDRCDSSSYGHDSEGRGMVMGDIPLKEGAFRRLRREKR